MRNNPEDECEVKTIVTHLGKRMDAFDSRLSVVEANQTNGFTAVNANIETLSQQLANMDKRLINDREKWHDVFRRAFMWVVRGGVIIITYAAGVNLTKTMFPMLFN